MAGPPFQRIHVLLFVGLIATFPATVSSSAAVQDSRRITVGLEVTEETGGLFESAFRTALRGLGDVDVVTFDETPAYGLSVVVACVPIDDCARAVTYSVAIEFHSALDEAAVNTGLLAGVAADETLANLAYEKMMFLARAVATILRPLSYHQRHSLWVANWGRQIYISAVQEMVAQLDSECFEKKRIIGRAAAAGDTTTTQKLLRHTFAGRNWIC